METSTAIKLAIMTSYLTQITKGVGEKCMHAVPHQK